MVGVLKHYIKSLFFLAILQQGILPVANAACGTTATATAGVTTIQSAVNAAPATLTAGDHCVTIGAGMYNEQVTVQNINTNNFRIVISSAAGASVTVRPPAGSTAAFVIANASVTLQGISILPGTNAIDYGVKVSSSYAAIKNIIVDGGAGFINYTGISLFLNADYTTIDKSTVTGYGSFAGALSISSSRNTISLSNFSTTFGGGVVGLGGNYNTISLSTIIDNTSNQPTGGWIYYTLSVADSSNTITQSYIANRSGGVAINLNSGFPAHTTNNIISQSTITSNTNYCAALCVGASSNTITQSYIANSSGSAVALHSSNNAIIQSTIISNSTSYAALDVGVSWLPLPQTSSNTITQSYITNSTGVAVRLNSSNNTISQSTVTSNNNYFSYDHDYFAALDVRASSNTITQSYIANPSGVAVSLYSSNNTIGQSTITSNNNYFSYDGQGYYYLAALDVRTSSNTITQSYIANPSGVAVSLYSSNNTISQSTITSDNNNFTGFGYGYFPALDVKTSSNTITQSHITNLANAAIIRSSNNTINQSTITTTGSWYALELTGQSPYSNTTISSNTILNSYVQGPTGIFVEYSTGTSLIGNTLVGSGTSGTALRAYGGNVALTISSNIILGGSSGTGCVFNDGVGSVTMTSNTILGAYVGLRVFPDASANLIITSMTFKSLSASAFGIYLDAGSPLVSTFSNVNFADSSIGVNVYAVGLAVGSRITMRDSFGPRTGPAFANDPNNLVYWVSPPLTGLSGSAQGISSITWTWNSVDHATGYNFYPSTGGPPITLTTLTLIQSNLSTNTAYSGAVAATGVGMGSLSDTATAYTLTAPPTSFALVQVGVSSITVSWAANTNPASITTYRVDHWIAGGSTTSVTVSATSTTLTSLNGGTTYFLTVQAQNGEGVLTPSGIILSTATIPLLTAFKDISSGGGIIVLNPSNGQGEVRVDIPVGAFSEAVVITLLIPASFPNAASPTTQLKNVGVGLEITLNKALQPAKDVVISISYQNASLLAGTDESKLIVARYDVGRNVWVPLVSTPDPVGNKVTAKTNHFSIFQIMEASPSNTVSTAKAFPNPFRPSQGHISMTFAALPANAKIKIYTLNGQLVKDLTADAVGMASWDVTNKSGEKAASGVYFVFAKGAGEKRTFKVIIQR